MNRFKERLQGMKSSGDKRLRNERERLYNKVRQMEQDIALLENNIGFFSKSKNADAMIADIREKIAKAKQELQLTIEKVRLIDARSAEQTPVNE
jgi:predicted ribosome quality control (RQC) complex YloA/Tae2 family protein